MTRYVIARLLAIVPTVLVLLLFVVVLVRLLPGNAVDIMLQEQAHASNVDRAELEARLGLDKGMVEAFLDYTWGTLQGNLGNSVWSRKPVAELVVRRMGVTLELSLLALAAATMVGLLVGIMSSLMQNSVLDYTFRSLSVLGLSVPNFALATAVIVLPVVWFGWSPSVIYTPLDEGLWAHVSQFFIPALVLGLSLSATLMRITRTAMLEVIRMDYIRTARAKGLPGWVVVARHALPNALIPVISLLGVQVAFLLSGTVIIESVFGLPGIGGTLLEAVRTRDYPVVQGITVTTGLLVILVNLLVDLSYGVMDPRVRLT